jgi:glutamate/tyrosine decarboxylase-like PLP-dependent enzyme
MDRWTEDEIRRVGHRVVDLIARHLSELPDGPVFDPVPPGLAAHFENEPLPEGPAEPDAILEDTAARVLPHPFGNGHPRFYGWVNSPPDVMGIFADALAAAMNPSCAGGNHAAIHVERQVVRWMGEMLGMPATGLLVSGGSMAALTALAVARHARAGFDVRERGVAGAPPLCVYKTAEGHGCYQKVVELLGLGRGALRVVPTDEALRMRPDALEAMIRDDRARGAVPIAVVATAGTVNTGAIDPLAAVADVCAAHGVWLHVDGAYGAPAVLSRDHASELSAMSRADSLAADPHKWLYVPVECGLVLVRDAAAMRDTFSLVPPYLRTEGASGGVSAGPWLSEFGFQQTRGFRALKLWMALKAHGREGYRASIERDIALARRLAAALRAAGDFDVWEPQGLSVVAFRHVPAELRGDDPAVDAHNKKLVERLQLGGRAFVSSTVLRDRFYLRACIVNPRATDADIDALPGIVRAAAAA